MQSASRYRAPVSSLRRQRASSSWPAYAGDAPWPQVHVARTDRVRPVSSDLGIAIAYWMRTRRGRAILRIVSAAFRQKRRHRVADAQSAWWAAAVRSYLSAERFGAANEGYRSGATRCVGRRLGGRRVAVIASSCCPR